MLGLGRPWFYTPYLHVSEHCPLPPGKVRERWSATAPGLVLSEENLGSRCCHSLGQLFRVHPSAPGEDSAPLARQRSDLFCHSQAAAPIFVFAVLPCL